MSRSLCFLFLCAACSRGPAVVVTVDRDDFVAADVRAAGGREELVQQARLAAVARRDDLAADADVRARSRKAERDVLVGALLERTMAEATSERALRAAYDAGKEQLKRRRIHVAHIVVDDGVHGDAIAARVAGGEDFAAVARAVSADAPSAARGGELPPVFEGEIDAAFFAAAWPLKQGETSGIVVTPFGRHIIKALAPPAEVTPTFDEARSSLAATLAQEATAKLTERAASIAVKNGDDK